MPFNTQAPWSVTIVDIVTLSRAFNVDYVNNTGKTMFVMVTVIHHVEALNDYATVGADVDTWNVATSSLSAGAAGINLDTVASLVFAVMPGSTYKLVQSVGGTGVNALDRWVESY